MDVHFPPDSLVVLNTHATHTYTRILYSTHAQIESTRVPTILLTAEFYLCKTVLLLLLCGCYCFRIRRRVLVGTEKV